MGSFDKEIIRDEERRISEYFDASPEKRAVMRAEARASALAEIAMARIAAESAQETQVEITE